MPDAWNTVKDIKFVTAMIERNGIHHAEIGGKRQLFASKWVLEAPSSHELVAIVPISYLNAHAGRELWAVGTA